MADGSSLEVSTLIRTGGAWARVDNLRRILQITEHDDVAPELLSVPQFSNLLHGGVC